jgi:hypothetical protein
MKLFHAYCEERTRAVEVLSGDSPLIRDRISFGRKRKDAKTDNALPVLMNSWTVTLSLFISGDKSALPSVNFASSTDSGRHSKQV